jgi:putative transposase
MVRYVHLNPLRAGIVSDLSELDRYPYSGHSRLAERLDDGWRETESVWSIFAESKQTFKITLVTSPAPPNAAKACRF